LPTPKISAMKKLVLPLAPIALVLALALPGGASAALHACGDDDHVYGLQTAGGTGCGVAAVVSSRLANRFSDSDDFGGNQSDVRITQRDANGNKWKCNWQSADAHNEIINWACNRGQRAILWVWREHSLGT
jgi:hypothetical protein